MLFLETNLYTKPSIFRSPVNLYNLALTFDENFVRIVGPFLNSNVLHLWKCGPHQFTMAVGPTCASKGGRPTYVWIDCLIFSKLSSMPPSILVNISCRLGILREVFEIKFPSFEKRIQPRYSTIWDVPYTYRSFQFSFPLLLFSSFSSHFLSLVSIFCKWGPCHRFPTK